MHIFGYGDNEVILYVRSRMRPKTIPILYSVSLLIINIFIPLSELESSLCYQISTSTAIKINASITFDNHISICTRLFTFQFKSSNVVLNKI